MKSLTAAVGGVLLAACIAAPVHGAPTDNRLPVVGHAVGATPRACDPAARSPAKQITSCNPLGRTRGPGAGAGLL